MTELATRIRTVLATRYDVERELGRGGMGVVFLARDLRHERSVALKVLSPQLGAAVGGERFIREVRIAAKLSHPHILTLIDSGEADGLLFYVMPYVDGESLRDRLDREKQLPLDDVLRITCEVADALSYAHSQGVVHRDIKPENILFQSGHAVVADFGIATAVSAASDYRLTETGLTIGTPAYMSPEQGAGGAVDARSDEYSLACVTYEMLVVSPPFTGATAQAVLARHSIDAVPRPSIVRPSISPAIEEPLLTALAKIPADRYRTASAFAEALTGGSARVRQPRRHLLARRSSYLLAGSALALVAAAAVLLVWRDRSSRQPRDLSGAPGPERLAVLYFRPIDADSLRVFADGLTEGLIRELSRVRALSVVSANGVLPYRNVRVAADSVSRAFGVGSLVEGTVTQAGSMLRVNVTLQDALDGEVLGSATFERPFKDILALEDTIGVTVALFLRQRLGQEISLRQDRERAQNAEAWRLVQQARSSARNGSALVSEGDTAAAWIELARADTLFQRAIALDPAWTTPHVERGWLAWTYSDVGNYDPDWNGRWTQWGIRQAQEALRLVPRDPGALTLRGTLRYLRNGLNLGGDPAAVIAAGDSAEADLRAAVEGDPQQTRAWSMLSHRLMRTGKTAEAKLAAMRAYESDPYAEGASGMVWRLYAASLDLEDRVEATRWCNEGNRRWREPEFLKCQITVQALPGQRADIPTMWRLLDENVRLFPPGQQEFRRRRGELLVAMAIGRAGLKDSARAVAIRARANASIDPSRDLVYVEMLLRNLLGDRVEALRLAAEYYAANPQARETCPDSGLTGGDWWMRGLADDPRYRTVACRNR